MNNNMNNNMPKNVHETLNKLRNYGGDYEVNEIGMTVMANFRKIYDGLLKEGFGNEMIEKGFVRFSKKVIEISGRTNDPIIDEWTIDNFVEILSTCCEKASEYGEAA